MGEANKARFFVEKTHSTKQVRLVDSYNFARFGISPDLWCIIYMTSLGST